MAALISLFIWSVNSSMGEEGDGIPNELDGVGTVGEGERGESLVVGFLSVNSRTGDFQTPHVELLGLGGSDF